MRPACSSSARRTGREATDANPDAYLAAGVVLAPDGFLHAVVENTSPVTVSGVRVAVGPNRWYGIHERVEYALDGTLAPGQSLSVRTELGPFTAKKGRQYGARVTRAVVVE